MTIEKQNVTIGLDVGSLFVKMVILDEDKNILLNKSVPHKGEIFRVTRAMIQEYAEVHDCKAISIIGQNAELIAASIGLEASNEVAANIHAVQQKDKQIRQIIDIGGGSLSLIEIDADGKFVGYQTNTMCAAGTGSFLDEQASRLGIDYEELSAFPIVDSPPSVAARCAVFAKSDLIHRQQEGYSKPDMWSGLCKGLTRTIIMTLFKGKKPVGKTAIVGGVAKNRDVMRWLTTELKEGIVAIDNPQEAGAYGAALLANPVAEQPHWDNLLKDSKEEKDRETRPPLELHLSDYPSFEVEDFYIDEEQNEVRITRWPEDGKVRGYIGIDIGSTSTKLLMIDDNEEAVLDIYRKTGGDPINATKSLFRALRTLVKSRQGSIEILGSGTTGSGRKLVGSVIGADRIVNEITAHVTGAMKVDPEIDTIFEIGGQDAKYIHTINGNLHNANMNYVCAAGTGSFVEEVSRKMGFDLFTLGDEVMGVTSPITSDRCTVFMDQDARSLLRKGHSPKEVMGAVMYSVVQNYLNKVVGNRYYSKEKVFFQGATARNKGLVAAFENLLGVEVVVSPYCHVMGSWGVALLTKKQMEQAGETTKFVGLEFAEKEVKLTSEECKLCANHCDITYAEVDGLDYKPSWGYLCGRDPEDETVKQNHEFRFFKQRARLWKTIAKATKLPKDAPVVYYPRALLTYNYYPMWRSFFAELGYNLKLSKQTDHEINTLASDWVGADYCHPVKIAHGHMRYLMEIENAERVFVPYMISAGDKSGKTSQTYFCPYNIALPAMMRAAIQVNNIDENRLITATMDFRWDAKTSQERLFADLGKRLKRSKKEIGKAWKAAYKTKLEFEEAINQAGRDAMAEISQSDKPNIVILGRPYNVFDPGANLALPEKITKLGFNVLPLEFLPIDEEDLGKEFDNMFWNYGKKILEAARIIARTPNLYAVYFSNFSCGPDSFIQTYAEEVMGEKPMLMLELDEHGADAGYLTRLEAFADVLGVNEIKDVPRYEFVRPATDKKGLEGRTLWVPPMGEGQPKLLAAALKASSIDAKPLPDEDSDSFLLGRGSTRGGECVPCPATLGTFFATVQREGGDQTKHALFMPTADGPCRFGQYCTLDRMAFDRMGWKDVPVVSWTAEDSYDGTDEETRRKMWSGIVIGDVLFKMRCRIKPYEVEEGQTEKIYNEYINKMVQAFESNAEIEPVMKSARDAFLAIPTRQIKKPLVGIIGEIYVRNNRFTNKDLVRRIEKGGGEAWLTPISEWVQYTAYMESWLNGYRTGSLLDRMGAFLKNRYLHKDEVFWTDMVSPILDKRHEPPISSSVEEGAKYLPIDFEGETIITLGRAVEFMKTGVDLVVNCAPFGCMPGAITSGVFQQVQKAYNVPVANMFYDGEGDINDIIETYIANLAANM